MSAIYNEIDGYAARWLTNLIDAGQIARGRVETRSVAELEPEDVRDAAQFHTFAGIGGWSYALRLAGWPDDAPVWTGSCPCQPFSNAGRGKGVDDERHLWPAWFELIRECRPRVVLGEQVASRAGLAWLDVVRADLEREGYAVGAADLAAAGVAAPHIRQRLYFVGVLGVADAVIRDGREGGSWEVGCAMDREASRGGEPSCSAPHRGQDVGLVDADGHDGPGHGGSVPGSEEEGGHQGVAFGSGASSGGVDPWCEADWIWHLDGKLRPAQPGSRPLADGVPRRVGAGGAMEARAIEQELRGYGNAIVPQVAAVWIGAVMEAIGMRPDVGVQARAALGES